MTTYYVRVTCSTETTYKYGEQSTVDPDWVPSGCEGHTLVDFVVESVVGGEDGGGGGPYIINLRAGDCIPSHDDNFAPVETLTGTNISRFVHSFDYAVPEFLRHEFTIPDDIDPSGNVKFEFTWFPRVPPVASEDIVLEVESVAIAAGENQDQALVSKGTVVSTADEAVDELIIEPLVISVSTLGWEAGDSVVVRFSRDADNALDTMDTRADTDDDALVQNIRIEIDRT